MRSEEKPEIVNNMSSAVNNCLNKEKPEFQTNCAIRQTLSLSSGTHLTLHDVHLSCYATNSSILFQQRCGHLTCAQPLSISFSLTVCRRRDCDVGCLQYLLDSSVTPQTGFSTTCVLKKHLHSSKKNLVFPRLPVASVFQGVSVYCDITAGCGYKQWCRQL